LQSTQQPSTTSTNQYHPNFSFDVSQHWGQVTVTLDTGATLNGAAMAQTGAVTLDQNAITVPVCLVESNGAVVIVVPPSDFTQIAGVTLTPNQTSVATALNSFRDNPTTDQLAILTGLALLTPDQFAAAYDSIAPTQYQSLGTIAFNLANAQNMELVQRLWGQRVAGSGFSMNGLPENTPIWDQGKNVVDYKNPTKNVLNSAPDYRWGMFVDGNGIFARANSANMLPTYNSQSGGVTTGLTYRWSDCFTTGLYAGYEGTYANFGGGSTLIDNSVRFGLLATYGQRDGKGLWVDGLVGGGYNNYNVRRNIAFDNINRTANSSPGAGELDTMLATGYDFKKGNWTFGPTASLQYTYLGVNSFKETGADSLNIDADGWNASSLLSTVGAQAAYTWMATKSIAVVPQINLGWQHEFMQNPYTINSTLNGSGPTFGNTSSAPIRDFLYTGIGATVAFGKRWNTSVFYNASAGNSDLVSQNVFVSVGVNF
jgi:outer membrane autotransporter protein